LRDALRYRQAVKRKAKSAFEHGEYEAKPETQDQNIESWEFWDCMKFVAEQKRLRKYECTFIYITRKQKFL